MVFPLSFRSRPRFEVGNIHTIQPDDTYKETRYLVVKQRQWGKPVNEQQKQWLYSGPILEIRAGKLVCTTIGYNFRQDSLGLVRGLE